MRTSWNTTTMGLNLRPQTPATRIAAPPTDIEHPPHAEQSGRKPYIATLVFPGWRERHRHTTNLKNEHSFVLQTACTAVHSSRVAQTAKPLNPRGLHVKSPHSRAQSHVSNRGRDHPAESRCSGIGFTYPASCDAICLNIRVLCMLSNPFTHEPLAEVLAQMTPEIPPARICVSKSTRH